MDTTLSDKSTQLFDPELPLAPSDICWIMDEMTRLEVMTAFRSSTSSDDSTNGGPGVLFVRPSSLVCYSITSIYRAKKPTT